MLKWPGRFRLHICIDSHQLQNVVWRPSRAWGHGWEWCRVNTLVANSRVTTLKISRLQVKWHNSMVTWWLPTNKVSECEHCANGGARGKHTWQRASGRPAMRIPKRRKFLNNVGFCANHKLNVFSEIHYGDISAWFQEDLVMLGCCL